MILPIPTTDTLTPLAIANPQSALPLLVTAEDAAVLLDASARTVWDMANAGDLPHLRIGRAVRFDRRDLLRHVGAVRSADALAAAQDDAADELLRIDAAAEALAISPSKLWELTAADPDDDDAMPTIRVTPRKVRFRVGAMLEWIERTG